MAPPDFAQLIPGLEAGDAGGGLKPMDHFDWGVKPKKKADADKEEGGTAVAATKDLNGVLPSLRVEGYRAKIPVVLLVLTAALRAQGCMEQSGVFPGVCMGMRQNQFGWIASKAREARQAMVDGTFMQRRWPLQVLGALLLWWLRTYPGQLLTPIPARRMMNEEVHDSDEKLDEALQLVAEPARSILLWAMEFMTELARNQECTGITKQDAANVRKLFICWLVRPFACPCRCSPAFVLCWKSDCPCRHAPFPTDFCTAAD